MEYTDRKHERTRQLRSRLSSPRQAIQQHFQKADNLSQLLKERFRSSMNQKHNHSLLMHQRLRLLNPKKLLGMHQKSMHCNNAVIVFTKSLKNITQIIINLLELGFEITYAYNAPILAHRQLAGNMVGI